MAGERAHLSVITQFKWVSVLNCMVLLCSTINSVAAEKDPLRYVITENSQDTLIADLVKDYKLDQKYTPEEINSLSFVFIENEQGLSYLFTVNRGLLEVKSPIDRDNICPSLESCIVNLDIKIQPSQYFEIIKIQIQVMDMNDNEPTFPKLVEVLNVSESVRVGTVLTLPQAVDNDSPSFGIRAYEIQPSSDTFKLLQDTSTGTRTVQLEVLKDLDREKKDLYTFQLKASDGGSPIKSSSLQININILDSNDNSPVFIRDNFVVSVNETIPVGSSILQVTAQDKDSGPNGVVTYSFDSKTDAENGNLFRVDSSTGQIFVKSTLDYETTKQHVLTVLAKDNNPEYSGAAARVTINLRDINDNKPNIKINDYIEGNSLLVPENSGIDYFMAHLTVVDLDSGSNGEFDCGIDKMQDFKLERLYPTEFKVTTAKSFDRESISQYNLTITCRDKGYSSQKASKTIPISVTDKNDQPPKFSTTAFVGNALESTPVGSYIMRVTSTDGDIGINSEIEYYIEDNFKDKFAIGLKSGNITLLAPLDHERNDRVQFVVTAMDKGNPRLSTKATVVVDVVDEDDNLPIFDPSHNELSVLENQLPATEVGKVLAVDKDSDFFNQFTYEMEQNDYFTIDPYSGKVFTKVTIDRETNSVHRMKVFAVSSTFNPTTSTATVTIKVNDMNDNDPIIQFPRPKNNTIHIANSLTRGEIVTYVKAYDVDSDNNALLQYTIIGGNSDNYFIIDSNIGAIMVHKSLSAIDIQSFGLVVKVQDSGLPPRTAETYLNIIVNKSLAAAQEEMLETRNLTIAISIACISGLIIVFLMVAIAVILRQRKANSKSRMYNYAPKVMDRNVFLHNNRNASKTPCAGNVHNSSDVSQNGQGFTNLSLDMDSSNQPHNQLPPFNNDDKHVVVFPDHDSDRDSACSADTDSGRGSNEDFSHEQIRHASDSSYQQYGRHPSQMPHQNQQSPDIISTKQTNPLYGVPNRHTSASWQHHSNNINTKNLQNGTHVYQQQQSSSSNTSNINSHLNNLYAKPDKSSSSEQLYRDRRRDLLYRGESTPPKDLSPAPKRLSDTDSSDRYLKLSSTTSNGGVFHEVHV